MKFYMKPDFNKAGTCDVILRCVRASIVAMEKQ